MRSSLLRLSILTFKMTPAMIRARRPYFWKNAVAFVILSSITTSVYFYTYSFLGKDTFDDIPIPPVSEEELAKLKAEYEAQKKLKEGN
ncbi:Cytochrome c oxidase assembly factor 3, mitochondrial [Cyberlindnera fabianii]|uniref:Cytochrome c oxidase assembly factor 3 n=1 Tax=Cyberlindnera fabianii TaxID=36022 RepID=A0A1V2L909_CYBFA|nr:Cytochrome c oxidase assembly factor 3, mitochondrial [Cyberlindnera fabianii]